MLRNILGMVILGVLLFGCISQPSANELTPPVQPGGQEPASPDTGQQPSGQMPDQPEGNDSIVPQGPVDDTVPQQPEEPQTEVESDTSPPTPLCGRLSADEINNALGSSFQPSPGSPLPVVIDNICTMTYIASDMKTLAVMVKEYPSAAEASSQIDGNCVNFGVISSQKGNEVGDKSCRRSSASYKGSAPSKDVIFAKGRYYVQIVTYLEGADPDKLVDLAVLLESRI